MRKTSVAHFLSIVRSRRVYTALIALLLIVSVQGCPDKSKTGNNGIGRVANGKSSNGATNGATSGSGTAGNGNGNSKGTEPAGLPEEPARALVLVPESVVKVASYPLKQAAKWPPRKELKDFAAALNKKPSAPIELRDLIEEVREWLSPSLCPKNPAKFAGVDSKGRIFLRLGPKGKAGLVSRDMVARMYTLAVNLPFKNNEKLDAKGIQKILAASFARKLVAELKTKKYGLEAHAAVKGKDYAGTAILNPSGCGMYFNYLYVYTNGSGLVAVLQHVPNRSKPPPARKK
jgi:hypothetical protein